MTPVYVDDVSMQFGNIDGLMPEPEDIAGYYGFNRTWGNRLFIDWFYSGLSKLELTPKPGVDKDAAIRHIKTIMGSFQPKHEDKEAAIAYLLDTWFEPGTWEKAKVTT